MKRRIPFVVPAILLSAAAGLTGCATTQTTICEFDKDGKIIKKTVTREQDAIDKITVATKDKTVVIWSEGWTAYISATIATTEDPTPTAKIFVGKVARGYMSILKDQANITDIAQVIKATKTDLSVNSGSVSSSASTASNP
ncbi:MAG: hypothetical protein PHH77_01640 [Victivallaceae bacterium]|nr:hypothetical protein [Victivallaceae bacterium]